MKARNHDHHVSDPIVRQSSAPHGTARLDVLDRRIMKLLRRDGRLTYAHTALAVGVSEHTTPCASVSIASSTPAPSASWRG